MSSHFSYMLLEIGMFLTIWLLSLNSVDWGPLLTKQGLWLCISLIAFWFTLDQVGLLFGLWAFPAKGTLLFRFFGLPLEEYLLFIIHTLMCYMLLALFRPEGIDDRLHHI
jgi:hypothetical protein